MRTRSYTALQTLHRPLHFSRAYSSQPTPSASAPPSDPPATPTTLVAPPSPISHLRPIRYASPSTLRSGSRPSSSSGSPHPYSTAEFCPSSNNDADELAFHLARERLDAFNDRFWADNNVRCEEARRRWLEGVREGEERDMALQVFWAEWAKANRRRYLNWTIAWWKGQLGLLRPAFRIARRNAARRVLAAVGLSSQ